MLMHGGTMTSGRRCTRSVDGAYWISSISGLRKTTLPGRHREVAADLEGARVAHRDAPVAEVGGEVGEALREAPAVGRERALQHLGVGRREIGRRERVDALPRHEREPPLVGVGQRGERGELGQVFARKQVRLLQQREERKLVPRASGEAVVARGVADDLGKRRRRAWRGERGLRRAPQRFPLSLDSARSARPAPRGRRTPSVVGERRSGLRQRNDRRRAARARAGCAACVHHCAHCAPRSAQARARSGAGAEDVIGSGTKARGSARKRDVQVARTRRETGGW